MYLDQLDYDKGLCSYNISYFAKEAAKYRKLTPVTEDRYVRKRNLYT
jgi:hypothetical protein